jgi:hypothetical protein
MVLIDLPPELIHLIAELWIPRIRQLSFSPRAALLMSSILYSRTEQSHITAASHLPPYTLADAKQLTSTHSALSIMISPDTSTYDFAKITVQ